MIDYILYYCSKGGEIMDFKELLKLTAEEYGTTPAEVEKEMKKAIKAAGLDLSPQIFISLCIDRIKKDYIS